ncbi:MAG: cytochrome c biogenesis protein CcsA [Bacteroidaceae bacterium]
MEQLAALLESPLSVMLAVAFLLLAWFLFRYAGQLWWVRLLGSRKCGITLMAGVAVCLLIEGTWAVSVHSSACFVILMFFLLTSLSLAVLKGLSHHAGWVFLLNHLGMFLILFASYFGSPDVVRGKMIVTAGESAQVAYDHKGRVFPLPFQATMHDFRIDYYADGHSPRQYTSTLVVNGVDTIYTSVNHPGRLSGYSFFQDSFDQRSHRYTVIQVVRDPWLTVIFCGMFLLTLGNVLLLFGRWHSRVVWPVTMVIAIGFTALTILKINFETLVPALRSWWFVPHLLIYMVAYALMAFAVVMWLVENLSRPHLHLSHHLMRSSSALLIIGMLAGSVWAQQCWGDYWAWDPKENWAAVTWLFSLVYLHMRSHRTTTAFMVILLAFLSLQITWYGVDFLPSAIHSIHTYK